MELNISDKKNEKSIDVSGRSVHKIWSKFADRKKRKNSWFLRRLDSRKKISCGHGGLCSERWIPAEETKRDNALSSWFRGGWFSQESGAPWAQRDRIIGWQLHENTRLAYANEEERAKRASRHEIASFDKFDSPQRTNGINKIETLWGLVTRCSERARDNKKCEKTFINRSQRDILYARFTMFSFVGDKTIFILQRTMWFSAYYGNNLYLFKYFPFTLSLPLSGS